MSAFPLHFYLVLGVSCQQAYDLNILFKNMSKMAMCVFGDRLRARNTIHTRLERCIFFDSASVKFWASLDTREGKTLEK